MPRRPASLPPSVLVGGRRRPIQRRVSLDGQDYGIIERLSSGRERYLVFDPSGGPDGSLRSLHVYARTPETMRRVRLLHDLRDARFPQIVRFSDQGHQIALVLAWVPGLSLAAYLSDVQSGRTPRTSPLVALRMVRNLAHALSHLHAAVKVIHGDVKPANIIVPRSLTHLTLIDFGSAWSVEQGHMLAGRGDGITRAVYAAPEQRRPDTIADFRSDQFSAGVIAYELLTGVIPYADLGGGAGATPAAQAEFQGTLVPPSQHRPPNDATPADVWRRIDQVVMRLLALDPQDRYAGRTPWLQAIDDAWAASDRRPTAGADVKFLGSLVSGIERWFRRR